MNFAHLLQKRGKDEQKEIKCMVSIETFLTGVPGRDSVKSSETDHRQVRNTPLQLTQFKMNGNVRRRRFLKKKKKKGKKKKKTSGRRREEENNDEVVEVVVVVVVVVVMV